MTRGSIPRNLWHLSWPQMAESFFSVADQLADLFWAGRVGYKAIAGLGVSQTYIMILMTARMGLDASMRAMISRAIGAGETSYANHVLAQSIVLTLVWSLVIGIPGIIFTDFLLGLVGVSEEVVDIASGYMKLQFIAMSIMSFQRLTGGALQAAALRHDFSVREVVTLASLIQKETGSAGEHRIVSAVYNNRLRIGMALQCDPTVIYALQLDGLYDGNLTRDNLQHDSPYNTYRYPGLPPGPIAAPGLGALSAAVDPEDVSYLYFVSRNDGSHEFANTLREHNRNVQRYQVDYFRARRRSQSTERD